jgi:hypothetical protein
MPSLPSPTGTTPRYRIRESVLHTRLETESVLLHLDSGLYFSLNSVGSRIWDRLAEGPRTIDDLLSQITKEYEVSPEQAEPDLLALLQELVRHKLLEPTDS